MHWKSQTQKRWKKNTILGALHRAKRISTNWEEEVKSIKQSFIKCGYPANFIQSVIDNFENPTNEDTIIPTHWFEKSELNYYSADKMIYCIGFNFGTDINDFVAPFNLSCT